MLLSARFLIDVANVNSFEHAGQVEFSAGGSQTIYLQLIDAALDRAEQGFSPAGRRYMPPADTTLQVTLVNVDDAKQVVRYATQPFALDPSVWSFPILPTDPLGGTVNIRLSLVETSRTLTAGDQPGLFLRVL